MLSKKANVLYYFLILVAIILLFIHAGTIITQKPFALAKQLGDVQIALLNTYNKAEQILFYIDASAKYALVNTVTELANTAGFGYFKEGGDYDSVSTCGSYLGYNLLNNKYEYCLPSENIKEVLKEAFGNKLNSYLGSYPHQKLDDSIYSDYIIKVDDNSLTVHGIAQDSIKIDVFGREKFAKQAEEEIKGIKLQRDVPITRAEPTSLDIPPENLGFVWDDICTSSSKSCYLRKESKERLDSARANANKEGIRLILSSGWRSIAKQEKLYYKFLYENGAEAAFPGKSQHHSGGAVDIIIQSGRYKCEHDLKMPECGYYLKGKKNPKNRLDYYRDSTTECGKIIHECRMKLKEIMESAGFLYPPRVGEWWHWEYKTPDWAVANGYGGQIYEMVG